MVEAEEVVENPEAEVPANAQDTNTSQDLHWEDQQVQEGEEVDEEVKYLSTVTNIQITDVINNVLITHEVINNVDTDTDDEEPTSRDWWELRRDVSMSLAR